MSEASPLLRGRWPHKTAGRRGGENFGKMYGTGRWVGANNSRWTNGRAGATVNEAGDWMPEVIHTVLRGHNWRHGHRAVPGGRAAQSL